jgi:membrane-bound ClpP family serine protease
MKQGVTPAQAQADLRAIMSQLAASYPATNTGRSAAFRPVSEGIPELRPIARLSWIALAVVGIVLLIGGIGLMTLDVRLRNLGVLSAAGIVAFGAGSVLAWSGVADAIAISPWLIAGAVLASILYYGFALTVALQSRDRIVNTQKGLIGLTGEARGKLAPEGPVYVKGAMWRGRTQGDPIPPGATVRVRGVDGLVLRVEAEPGGEAPVRFS